MDVVFLQVFYYVFETAVFDVGNGVQCLLDFIDDGLSPRVVRVFKGCLDHIVGIPIG